MTKRIRRNQTAATRHIDDKLMGSAYSYYSGVVRTHGEARTPHGLKRIFAAALLSGASLLAVGVAGSGTAKAGTCNTIGTQVICTGSFTESVQYHGVEDLTVTLGAGSTIDTTGDTSEADFDNAGIFVTGDGNVSIFNNGSILTGDNLTNNEEYYYYGGYRHHGIAAYSDEGHASVQNSAQGTIVTTSDNSHGAIAVSGFEEYWGGTASAVNHGLIGTEGDNSYGLVAIAKYTASANNSGFIVTDGEGSTGIHVSSKYEAIVTNSGSIETWGDDADGIFAFSAGSIAVTNSGSIETIGENADGIVAVIDWSLSGSSESTSVIVTNTGSIVTEGDESDGIFVDAADGTATITNSGLIVTDGYASNGISAGGYSVSVTNDADGEIVTNGDESHGVELWGQSVSLDNAGAIITWGEDAHAVVAYSGGPLTTTINNSGTIGAHGDEADAIRAGGPAVRIHNNVVPADEEIEDSVDAVGVIFSEDGAAIRVEEAGDARIYNAGYIYGHVTVEAADYGYLSNDGLIESSRRWKPTVSIDVDEGDAVVVNSGDIFASGRDAEAVKLEGDSVSLTNSGTIAASGKRGHAVDLEAEGVYGEVTLTNSGLIDASGEHADAIRAEGHKVTITNQATVIPGAGEGDEDETVYGVIRSSERAAIRVDEADYVYVVNDGFIYGYVTIDAEKYASVITGENSLIRSERRNVAAVGIEVQEGNAYAYNLVSTNEDDEEIGASIVTHGDGSVGIHVRAWEGTATAVNSGSITTHGKYASGIVAVGETVNVSNAGTIVTSGDFAHGVEATSNSIATTNVYNDGTIEVTGEGAHGILADGPTVNITNTVNGSISSAGGDAIHVFNSKYVSIINHGDISGDVVVAGIGFYGEYTPEVYVLHTGYIDGNIITANADSDDTIVIDGGRITGAIFTGDGTDEVTVQGEGVELGKGIHAGGEGTAHLTFAHDDEIVLDDGIEGWAVSGFNLVGIDSGRLVLDGYGIHTAGEEGAVNVAGGAVLATTGEGAHVAAAEVNIDGTLDIGLGGFFDATGDVSFGGDSLFFTRVQSATAGVVSGNTVTFAEGATIFADVSGGIEAVVGEDILIASAAQENGVTDHGAVVEDNIFLFYFAKVMNGDIIETGSADQLFLRVQIEETAFDTADDAGYTRNELSIADALDVYLRTQPLSSPLVRWLAQFETEEEQRAALLKVIKDTLPEESNGSGTATMISTDLIYDMIMDRLSGGGFTVAQSGETGMSAGDAQLGGDGKWAIWGRAGASRAKFTPGSVNGFDADSWGITVGIDGEIAPNTRIGFGGFYIASDVEENGAGANATNDITGYGATAYLSYRPGAWYVNGALGFGTNEYDSRRLSLGGVNVANYDGTQFVARAEAGYMFTSGQWDITPNVGLRYNRVDVDAFTETGPLPISVDSQTVESLRAVAGVNVRYSMPLENGGKLIPELGVKLLGELADPAQAITGSVVGGGAFTVQTVARDDVSFGLGGGITWEVSDRFSLRITYDGELQSDYDEHALAAAVRFAF